MLRIIIVDDEPFFLDFLSGFIDWEAHGLRLAGTAFNGRAAMNLLGEHNVDVVITDIKMPVMDGLELICAAGERHPGTQFIVLSSYSEFSMVGEAFKLGVKDYVLKPEITAQQLLQILDKCRETRDARLRLLQKNKEQMQAVSAMQRKVQALEDIIRRSHSVMKNGFFNDCLDRGLDWETIVRQGEASSFLLPSPPCALMLVRVDDFHRIVRDIWQGDQKLLEAAVLGAMEEVTAPVGAVIFSRTPDEYAVVLTRPAARDTAGAMSALSRSVAARLQEQFGIGTLHTLSSLHDAPVTLQATYKQARDAGELFFCYGKENLLFYDALKKTERLQCVSGDELDDKAAHFTQLLYARDIGQLQEALDSFKVPPLRQPCKSNAQIRRLYQRYFLHLSEYVQQFGKSDRAENLLEEYQDYLTEYGTLVELNDWLEAMVTYLVQAEFSSSNLVKRVKKYILTHYQEELSLKTIADQMAVNPSYLSRCFSQSEQEGLFVYINKVRIRAAINLLQDTNAKHYEIAYQVGYNSVEHFSRMFRKIMGKSPREYLNG